MIFSMAGYLHIIIFFIKIVRIYKKHKIDTLQPFIIITPLRGIDAQRAIL